MSVLNWDGLSHYDFKLKEKISEWLTGKAESVHHHLKSDITDFPALGTASEKDIAESGNASENQVVMGNDSRLTDSRKASDVYDWAKTATKPTYTKDEVGLGDTDNTPDSDKAVYSASHLRNDLSRPTSANFDLSNEEYVNKIIYTVATASMTTGKPPSDAHLLSFGWDTTLGWGSQIALGNNSTCHLYIRGANSNNGKSVYGDWKTILDSTNYTSYAADKDHNHSKILDSGDGRELTLGYSKDGVTASDYTSLACWCGTELRCVDKAQFATANHNHSKILDSNDSRELTFAYSKSGMDSSDYSWLAAWNGSELRAVNKSQFASSDHTHTKYVQKGIFTSGTSVSLTIPVGGYWFVIIGGSCAYKTSSNTNTTGLVYGLISGYSQIVNDTQESAWTQINMQNCAATISGTTITITGSNWVTTQSGSIIAAIVQLN